VKKVNDKPQKMPRENLLAKIEDLQARLAIAEETLQAIGNGEVDALVVGTEEGSQVFSLTGAEKPYRIMVETMSEGALTMGLDGTMLYCNPCFAAMLKTPIENIIGKSLYLFIKPDENALLKRFVGRASRSDKMESSLQNSEGTHIPVLLSLSDLGNVPPISICLLVTDITEQKLAAKKIRASLLEKETMLKEIHHRVRNNLQVIAGLLQLQAKASKHPELIEHFQESQNRIHAMAMVHEKLYTSGDFSCIDLIVYIKSLSQELFQSYNINHGNIDMTIRADQEVLVNIHQAIPCGLVMNELISNALKHAFPNERPGALQIIIRRTQDTEIEIIVHDNGLGLPVEVDIHKPRSMGLDLVNGLVKNQLYGKIEVKRDQGTEFRITFPLR
jgi:PAS domain S-box-containing protein